MGCGESLAGSHHLSKSKLEKQRERRERGEAREGKGNGRECVHRSTRVRNGRMGWTGSSWRTVKSLEAPGVAASGGTEIPRQCQSSEGEMLRVHGQHKAATVLLPEGEQQPGEQFTGKNHGLELESYLLSGRVEFRKIRGSSNSPLLFFGVKGKARMINKTIY